MELDFLSDPTLSVAEKMKDREKTIDQLVGELAGLRQLLRDVQAMVEEVLGESQDGLQLSTEGMPAGAGCQQGDPSDEKTTESAVFTGVLEVPREKNLHGLPTEAETPSAAILGRTSAPPGPTDQRIWLAKRAILYLSILFIAILSAYPLVSTSRIDRQPPAASQENIAQMEMSSISPQKEEGEPTPLPATENLTEYPAKDSQTAANEELSDAATKAEKSSPFDNAKLSIPFNYKSETLPDVAQNELHKISQYINEKPELSVIVRGFTDSVGSYEYNRKLSLSRANMVKDYLVKEGISPSRIIAIGMGEQNPLKPNTTEEGREANRRVELELTHAGDS